MPDTTIAVAGLGRCGLTMTMQMLDAGGLDVWGDPPAYESSHYAGVEHADAVKLVDPIGNEITGVLPEPVTLMWVWLMRDAKQQAKSMAKMLDATGKKVDWRRLRKTIRPSTREHFRYIERRGEQLLKPRFESAIKRPKEHAAWLRDVTGRDLDVDAAAAVVDDRKPEAEDDLSRELSFL